MDIFSTYQLQQIKTFPTLRTLPRDEDDKQTFGQTVVSTFTYSLDFPWERRTIMIITHFLRKKIPLPFTYLAVLFPIGSKRTSHFSTIKWHKRKCRKFSNQNREFLQKIKSDPKCVHGNRWIGAQQTIYHVWSRLFWSTYRTMWLILFLSYICAKYVNTCCTFVFLCRSSKKTNF